MSGNLTRALLGFGLLIWATILPAAAAQPVITLYLHDKYEGASLQLILPTSNLQGLGFANKTTSFIVSSGTWKLCSAANFSGKCILAGPGKYPATFKSGFAHTIVSLQPATAAAH